MPQANEDARHWLKANNYEDIDALIDKVESIWARKGTGTRRSWWLVLAGNSDGSGKIIEGVIFPVLRVAQIRMGRPATKGSICRNKNEVPPPKEKQARWLKKG
jgi:hypothetical protein